MTGERETVIRSILKSWPWVVGAAVFAATVIALSWVGPPEVFRTSVELRIQPPNEQYLWEDRRALAEAVDAEGRKVIAVVMGGEAKEAAGRSMAARYDLDLAAFEWWKAWTEVWESRVTVAGPVDGAVFLIVDDEDGERGVALASAVLESLETDWRRRDDIMRQEGLRRLDRMIGQDMVRLDDLVNQASGADQDLGDPQGLALAAERDLTARNVAALRIRRSRLEIPSPDDAFPWVVVSKPLPFEYHVQRKPRLVIIMTALSFVLLVGVGRVAWDRVVCS